MDEVVHAARKYCPKFMTPSSINQAAPVQNMWYTVLGTNDNVELITWTAAVAAVGETLEARLTVDGVTLTGSQVAVAGTVYFIFLDANSDALIFDTSWYNCARYATLKGRVDVKCEVRKTTAAGAGNLTSNIKYQQW